MRSCPFCGDSHDDAPDICHTCGTNTRDRSAPETGTCDPIQPVSEMVSIDPEILDTFRVEDHGIQHPDWAAIEAHLAANPSPLTEVGTFEELVRWWLSGLSADLGGDYRIYRRNECWLLSDRPAPMSRWLLDTVLRVRARILGQVGGSDVAGEEQWPVVVLHFGELDDFQSYTLHFFPECESGVASYDGVMIGGGYFHVAVPHRQLAVTTATLAHELTHLVFCQNDLPRWLDEGLACHFERSVAGTWNRAEMLDDIPEHLAYWTEERIQHFWSGTSFFFPDDGQRLSYALAMMLTRRFMEETDRFADFVAHARSIDAGQTASLDVMGECLGDILSALLGPGSWRPARKQMADSLRSHHNLDDAGQVGPSSV